MSISTLLISIGKLTNRKDGTDKLNATGDPDVVTDDDLISGPTLPTFTSSGRDKDNSTVENGTRFLNITDLRLNAIMLRIFVE